MKQTQKLLRPSMWSYSGSDTNDSDSYTSDSECDTQDSIPYHTSGVIVVASISESDTKNSDSVAVSDSDSVANSDSDSQYSF